SGHTGVALSRDQFAARFAQALAPAEQAEAYASHISPAPAHIFIEALAGPNCRVDYANPARPPLLLMVGDADLATPAATVRANAHRQRGAGSRTDLQVFAGRTHWLCNEPGWEEVADFTLDWGLAHVRPS